MENSREIFLEENETLHEFGDIVTTQLQKYGI